MTQKKRQRGKKIKSLAVRVRMAILRVGKFFSEISPMRGKLYTCVLCTCLATLAEARADVVITFANNGAFDGDAAGKGRVGASQVYTDLAAGASATLTTVAVNGNTTPSSTRETRVTSTGDANPNLATQLGVNNAEFTAGTSWTVDFSGDTYFKGLVTGGFRAGKKFTIESTAWSALSITPGSANVTFAAGKFTIDGAQSATYFDTFTLFDLTGAAGNVLFVSAGTDIKFASVTGSESLVNFTVAIPEPSSFVLVGMAAGGFALVRRRMGKFNKSVEAA